MSQKKRKQERKSTRIVEKWAKERTATLVEEACKLTNRNWDDLDTFQKIALVKASQSRVSLELKTIAKNKGA